ncbi:secretin N-terminal domain-containing protein [Kushneria aurantia]|uniref:Secretin N-terminal domain-containing protein n=1 Tax=Kushneria aurantia TaxID=504092 RepID=A0ABV6G1M7_9GAMM|nr:secretin N-terminal domain-containing protein [Kushneria aurantia]
MRKFVVSILLGLVAGTAHAIPIEMQDTDVRDFVQWYADHTGRPLVVAPDVSGTVTAWADDVSEAQLPDFFRGVLRANGYRIGDGTPPVVEPTTPARNDFMRNVAADSAPAPPIVSRVFTLDSIRADDAQPLIASFLDADSATGSAQVQLLRGSNGLLVSATAEQLDRLEPLLPSIDRPSDQVLIQAILFETTEGDSFDFSFAAGRARNGSDLAGGFNTSALGDALAYAGGSFGIFDGSILSVALRAIERNSSARILSTPQVLTLSGERGIISVGQNVPIVTGRLTGQAADVTNPFQTIERRDVGVRLDVLPVVSSDGLIVMAIDTNADSVSSSVQASDIVTNQRSITTTVQIRSGQALLLGGLVSEERSDSDASVPVLSDLPLIGGLFRSTSRSYQHRKLYVLLRATVLPTVAGANT